MKNKLIQLITSSGDLTIQEITINILVAALIGVFICISYAISHRGTIYSRKFNISLAVLTTLTGTVMTVIGNNVALSLGMVGALSIVRFRTAIKDSRDTVYIFWAVIVGICCGVGDFPVAAIGSCITFFMLLLLGSIRGDNRMLIIVRADRSQQSAIQSRMFQFFDHKAVLRVHNTTVDGTELIYEVTSSLLQTEERKRGDITDALYALGGVEYVNVVMQNDDISN